MEEKRYPVFDEEGTDMCSEPFAELATSAVARGIGSTGVVEGVVSDDDLKKLDWERFPSLGPFSENEAVVRIDKFEDNLSKDKVEWLSSEDFDRQLYAEFPWLR